MAGEIVQSRYEQLEEIARRFERAADEHERLHSQLLRQVAPLRGGSWIGRGVVAFLHEMDDEVLPSHLRLIFAQEEAGRVTREIAGVLHEAEERAAALFQGEGTGETTGDAASSSATAGTVGDAGAQTPARERVALNNMREVYAAIEDPKAPAVRIVAIRGESGQLEYVILCKGTLGAPNDTKAWFDPKDSRTWFSNFKSGLGYPSSYTSEIQRIIKDANLPPGATIHFAGHSQGGHAIQIVAREIVAGGQYRVGSVTGFGTYQLWSPTPGVKTSFYMFQKDELNAVNRIDDATVGFGNRTIGRLMGRSVDSRSAEVILHEDLRHNDYDDSRALEGKEPPFSSSHGAVVYQENPKKPDAVNNLINRVRTVL